MKNRRERTLLIVGAGGLGQDVADIATLSGRYVKIAFLDDNPSDEKQRQYPIVGSVDELELFKSDFEYCIAAVGNNQYRMNIHNRIKELGYEVPILIHPTAIVHALAKLERGDIIRAMCYVSSGVEIGESVLLNIGCKIDHNCVINEGCHIPMGAVIRNEVIIPVMSTYESNCVVE